MAIDRTRQQGGVNLLVAEKIDRRNIWRVRADIQPIYDEENKELQTGVSFIEKEFCYKPTMIEVKDYIHSVINAKTDDKILSGFVWNNINVWLSEENQRNFSEAQRIAASMPQAILPVTFKLGEDAEGNPLYYKFETAEELTQFYLSAVAYINQCLAEGWQQKDIFDFSPYEEALNPSI